MRGEVAPQPSAPNPVSSRILDVAVIAAVAAVAAQTALHLFNAWALDYRWGFFDVASDEDLFAWASAVATFAAALGALLFALAHRAIPVLLLVLAGILALLSLDDIATIHELLGGYVQETLDLWENADRLAWPLIFFPALLVAAVLLFRVSQNDASRGGRLIQLGLGLLVLAVGLEILSEILYIWWDDGDLPLVLQLVAEEGAELGGWMLIASGLLAIAVARQWRWAMDESSAASNGRTAREERPTEVESV